MKNQKKKSPLRQSSHLGHSKINRFIDFRSINNGSFDLLEKNKQPLPYHFSSLPSSTISETNYHSKRLLKMTPDREKKTEKKSSSELEKNISAKKHYLIMPTLKPMGL